MFLFCPIYWYSYRVVHSGECEHHHWLVRGCWLHGTDWVNKDYTRMHSSRMRTARSSSCQGVCLSACWNTAPPVWSWRTPWPDPSISPLGVAQARPLNFPPGVGLETPPHQPDPSSSPLGVGLERCKACLDTPPTPFWIPAGHAGMPPPPLLWTDRHV